MWGFCQPAEHTFKREGGGGLTRAREGEVGREKRETRTREGRGREGGSKGRE